MENNNEIGSSPMILALGIVGTIFAIYAKIEGSLQWSWWGVFVPLVIGIIGAIIIGLCESNCRRPY